MLWGRSDFEQTLLKFLTWRLLAGKYDEVAFVDADMIFTQPPDSLFQVLTAPRSAAAHRLMYEGYDCQGRRRRLCPTLDFAALQSERLGLAVNNPKLTSRNECRRAGWQTGVMLLRPSVTTYFALLARARTGNYSAWTQTEQDVLDAHFDPAEHCLREDEANDETATCSRHVWLGARRILTTYVKHHKVHAHNMSMAHDSLFASKSNALISNLTLTLCRTRSPLTERLPAIVPLVRNSVGMPILLAARHQTMRLAKPQTSKPLT